MILLRYRKGQDMDKFILYYFISGLLMFSWFYYEFNYSKRKEEADDAIADVTWNTGIKREYIRWFLYSSAILFGFLMLPFEIISGIIGEVSDES